MQPEEGAFGQMMWAGHDGKKPVRRSKEMTTISLLTEAPKIAIIEKVD